MFEQEDKFISLANKYRPQTFEDIIGQGAVSKTLSNAIKMDRVGHAYLFYGPRGTGKTTSARIFARALNCTGNGDKPSAVPCGKCPQCVEIAEGSDIDVLELDAASNTQVEKIREAIIDTVSLSAVRDRFKIFILDEVHMLSGSSFNALLKTIEEPPAHVIFILATTEKNKVPQTISSRCQTFRFRPITQQDIAGRLSDIAQKEGIKITQPAITLLSKSADGAMRDAVTLLDRSVAYSESEINEDVLSEMLGLMPHELLAKACVALLSKDSKEMHEAFDVLGREGYDPLTFLRDLKNLLGELFYYKLGHTQNPLPDADALTAEASAGFIAGLTRKISRLIEEVKFSDNALLSAEVGLFTVMDSCVDIDAFVRRLEALESGAPISDEEEPKPKKEKPVSVKIMPARVSASATVHKTELLQPAVEPPAAQEPQPQATAPGSLSEAETWHKIKAAFAQNPFVSDALNNCSVNFKSPAEWELVFEEAKSFYKTAAEMKSAEFETKSKEVCGRKIKFGFIVSASAAPKPEPKKSVLKPAINKAEDVISKEEPFVKQDFSAQFAPAPAEVSDGVKRILNFIPGDVLE